MPNLNSEMKKQITAALFFFAYNLTIGCSKKNRENYHPENAFERKKKKPRIKFNPWLAIIGLWITGARLLVIALPAHPRHQSLAFFRLRRLDTRSHLFPPGSEEETVRPLMCSKKLRNRLKIFRGLFSQGSYRFLDPKLKTFSRLFSKTIISFSRLEVIKWAISTELKKSRNKAFFTMHYKRAGEIE